MLKRELHLPDELCIWVTSGIQISREKNPYFCIPLNYFKLCIGFIVQYNNNSLLLRDTKRDLHWLEWDVAYSVLLHPGGSFIIYFFIGNNYNGVFA